MFTGIDLAQLSIAAMATASYAFTSIVAQRVYLKRRRRELRAHARFVTRLIAGARAGSVQTLPDLAALEAGELSPQRLEWLIRRAVLRLLRRSSRANEAVDAARTDREASIVLRRLLYQSQAATMEELVRKAGVAAADRDLSRLEATQQIERAASAAPAEGHLRIDRRESQRRIAWLLRGGLVGIGCIVFVEVVLAVWQALR
jgi:hypothetical protein